ncbi:MAG: type II toxin-antitoxin system RelE/ParE family toxin [Oscillospiraceae bacterium]|nr:type II toxin-antitoxin system RelE/ParE family toxin [Oscillospiraceae bacterium]
MEAYKVKVTNSADNDLNDIAQYISSELNAPQTALKMTRAIREAISKLEKTALLRPLVRDKRLAALGYRPLVIKNYIAFYVVNEKEKLVAVDRIIYGRRDWQNIL